uniref:Aldehyde dehydrogenase domain-containing protein n=1 Tax=Lactuca sativa TaxID=4236 RepID=A0A9R1WNL6_LACSA|nr:hypothetical protein LSAT_V11C100041470 [Lactuca sativa]
MFAETGEALVSSVDKIVIVNSPGVGRMIMRKAADTLILVILVLGGKDLFIVYEAVDVAHGPPQLGKYDMGVICMQDHSERFQSLINDALDKGAEIVGGGNVRDISEGAVDQYFPPTVIVNVNHQMKLMQEELPCKNCDKYGCITSAETVMLEKKSVDEFLSNINNGRNVIISLSL